MTEAAQSGSKPSRYLHKSSAARAVARLAEASGAPYSAMLEIADRCNEACIHCYQIQGQKGELPTETWERVLDELAEMGVMILTLSGGEPTLRKDFLHLVAYARRLRFAVKIYSNALNITPSMAAELGRLAVQEVQISLYSHEAAAHDSVTRVPGSFERAVAATRDLIAAGVRVLLKTPMLSTTQLDVSRYIDFVTSLGADYAIDPKLNPREDGDAAPRALAIDKATHLALLRQPRLRANLKQGQKPQRKHVCGACRGNVHVEPNGELRPCTQWAVPTGDVTTGVARAWHDNPTARAIRELDWDALPGCRVCDLRPYCKRCFASAEREVGNALLPYPSACRSARWSYESRHGIEPAVATADGVVEANAEFFVGPYRRDGEHRFHVEPIDVTEEDRALMLRQGSLRSISGARDAASVGPLVQLKRPPRAGLTSSQMKPSTSR
jgi:radical SAM protein with 4Fe4S-binding SPASM domain